MVPQFFKKMPAPETGRYTISVYRVNPFSGARKVWSKTVSGKLRAYLLVRLRAFWEDMNTPYWDGEVGIVWEIRKP